MDSNTFVFLLVVFAASVTGLLESDEEKWFTFQVTHRKHYIYPAEERSRYFIFLENLEKIEKHNQNYDSGLVSYKLGITQFADLSDDEFLSLLTYNSVRQSPIRNLSFEMPSYDDVPPTINWLEKGAVTPVKNQEGCGSCWSFSATGALEGQYFRKTSQLIPLSEQNLIDCSRDYDNQGCSGGIMDYAFQYVADNGILSEQDYPYTGHNGICRYDSEKSILTVQSIVDLESGSESQLEAAVGTVGPIAVAVDASYWSYYSEGIFNYFNCKNGSASLNHGVLLVGYGANEDGIAYWLIKNSWGPTWGEDGYIRLAKNGNNQCGVATAASYPVV